MLFFKKYSKKQIWTGMLLAALAAAGLYLVWQYFQKEIPAPTTPNGETAQLNEFKNDKFEPTSQIKSPPNYSWQRNNFEAKIVDDDLESGLDGNFCQYKIISYKSETEQYSSGWLSRKCNTLQSVSVGDQARCFFEGENTCWIYARSRDKVGNIHSPAERKDSIKFYSIDWTKPSPGKIYITSTLEEQTYPIKIKEDISETYKIKVTDNFKITGCNLYVDGINQGMMTPVVLGCEKECIFIKDFIFYNSGVYTIYVRCQDAAGNRKTGEKIEVKTNLPPEISYCQVEPVQGDTAAEFQFSVEAVDPDNDELFYSWDFGDGENSNEKNPKHCYNEKGDYKPKVIVSDHEKKVECSTAWVSVDE